MCIIKWRLINLLIKIKLKKVFNVPVWVGGVVVGMFVFESVVM